MDADVLPSTLHAQKQPVRTSKQNNKAEKKCGARCHYLCANTPSFLQIQTNMLATNKVL